MKTSETYLYYHPISLDRFGGNPMRIWGHNPEDSDVFVNLLDMVLEPIEDIIYSEFEDIPVVDMVSACYLLYEVLNSGRFIHTTEKDLLKAGINKLKKHLETEVRENREEQEYIFHRREEIRKLIEDMEALMEIPTKYTK